jgi:hypothetical protein
VRKLSVAPICGLPSGRVVATLPVTIPIEVGA